VEDGCTQQAFNALSKEELIAQLLALKAEVAKQSEAVAEKDREIEKLHHIIRTTNRKSFVTKRDVVSPHQAPLFPLPALAEAKSKEIEVPKHTRKLKRGRKPIPATIERERVEHYPAEMKCDSCGEELRKIGEEVTEELEYYPARFKLFEHARIKCACPKCKIGVEVGELPAIVHPLEKARPGAGLLSQIIISKYVDHLPLYRQEQMYARLGLTIHRQRMCDWIGLICEPLAALERALYSEVLKSSYLQADETTIKVQDAEVKKKCALGYFWTLYSPEKKLGYFRYYDTRASDAALDLLKDFRGTVQTDLYAGYNEVILPGEVERIACLAHVRRKFVDAHPAAKEVCDEVLRRIGELYRLEKEWGDLAPPDRGKLREEKSRLLVNELRLYLETVRERTLPKAIVMESISYALKQWRAVERIFERGEYHLDNNAVERQIRPVAIGRKNWLFAGSHDGARRAAMLYSFFTVCKLHDVNPFDWLKDVIQKLAVPGYTAAELLPHRWKLTR
jgi:transposase